MMMMMTLIFVFSSLSNLRNSKANMVEAEIKRDRSAKKPFVNLHDDRNQPQYLKKSVVNLNLKFIWFFFF